MKRKRQKKLRQKEQKAREERHRHEVETKGNVDSTGKTSSPVETSLDTYDIEAQNPEEFASNTPYVPLHCPETNEGKDGDPQSGYDFGADQNIEGQPEGGLQPCIAVARWKKLPNSQHAIANDLHTNKNPPISSPQVVQKYRTRDDQRADAIVNTGKAWDERSKLEIDRMVLKTVVKTEPHSVQNHELLIGSISVNFVNCNKSEGNVDKQNSSQDKPKKLDLLKSGKNQSTAKPSTPVCRFDTKVPFPVQSGAKEVDAVNRNEDSQNLSKLCSDGSDIGFENKMSNLEGSVDPGRFKFSSQSAKAFLAQSKHCYLLP